MAARRGNGKSLANVGRKVPRGAAALATYGAIAASKPVAAVASSLGLPDALPRLCAEVAPATQKKSNI